MTVPSTSARCIGPKACGHKPSNANTSPSSFASTILLRPTMKSLISPERPVSVPSFTQPALIPDPLAEHGAIDVDANEVLVKPEALDSRTQRRHYRVDVVHQPVAFERLVVLDAERLRE